MMRRAAPFALRPFALGLFGLTLLPLVPGVARAQTSADGAKALEQQIHDWIASTVGPNVTVAPAPIHVVANGDHYDLSAPLGNTPDAPLWTATARQQSGGRWAIENIRLPSPAEFHVKLPDQLTQGGPPGMTGTVDYKLSIGKQTAQILLDPTFATTTTTTSSIDGLDVTTTGGMAPQTSHIDHGNSTFIMQPSGTGRIDVSLDSNLQGYRIESVLPNMPGPFKLSFGKASVKAQMDSVSRDRAVQVLQGLISLGNAISNAGDTPAPGAATPQESAAILLEAFADLATGASLDETLQNVAVETGGMAGSLDAFQIGFGIKGVGGMLQARLDLGAEGLTLPELGLGSMVQLIPTKVSFRPIISGVPADAVMALAKASSEGDDPTPENIMALFAHGPIVAGLDSMKVAVAGAEFTGLGKVQIASPQDISGTGQITATNLDLLQQKIAAEPSLAQAGPVIIFLKGIGRSVGNQMVWDITYRDGHVLVNNQDLSAMTGGGGGGGGGAQRQSTRPQPVTPPQSGQSQLHRRP